MIERDGTDQVGGTGEGDESDAIVGAFVDEFSHHRFDHFDAVDALIVDHEIERLHRAGDVESQHDVDAVGGHFGTAVAALRAREADDHEHGGEDGEQPYKVADPAAAAAGHRACEPHIGILNGGDGAAPSPPEHHQRQQSQGPEPLGLQESRHACAVSGAGGGAP